MVLNAEVIICKASPLCFKLAGLKVVEASQGEVDKYISTLEKRIDQEVNQPLPAFTKKADFEEDRAYEIARCRGEIEAFTKAKQAWKSLGGSYRLLIPEGVYLIVRKGKAGHWYFNREEAVSWGKRLYSKVTVIG